MGEKLNCWEIQHCGREPGGARAAELGVCAAASYEEADGLNGGRAGGRICWAISGTLGTGCARGSFAGRRLSCMTCSVYHRVKEEEGVRRFQLLIPGQLFQVV